LTDADLRAWAEAHGTGESVMPQARAVLRLLESRARLLALVQGLADRVFAQAELLGRKAESPLPPGPPAGERIEGA
jgi:hypothetical protein